MDFISHQSGKVSEMTPVSSFNNKEENKNISLHSSVEVFTRNTLC